MKKNVKTKTKTEIDYVPAYYIEINPYQDPGSEEYYKNMGYEVKTMEKFGKKRIYAIIPIEGYAEASDAEKNILASKVNVINRKLDNVRRTDARKSMNYIEYETLSLDVFLEAGYDPTLDVIDVAISIDKNQKDSDEESDETYNANIYNDTDTDCNDCKFFGKKQVNRGAYNPDTDENNPAYILAKKNLFERLYEMLDELEGEELEIATAIMNNISQRQFAKDRKIPRTTVQGHWDELIKKCKKTLKDYYI